MAKILGTSFAKKFRLGYLVSNQNRIGRFTPEDTAVGFGKLLKYGSSPGHYEVCDGSETDATQIAGVSVYDQAKTGSTYPGTITEIPFGEYGDALDSGDIVVEFTTSVSGDVANAVEGAKVYLDATDGKVTDTPNTAANLLLPQFKFLGQTETDEAGNTLVSVRKLY